MTLCFLQSDPYPRPYSRTEACLDLHILPDQNLRERENTSETDSVILLPERWPLLLCAAICYYVVRLKPVTGNEGDVEKRSIHNKITRNGSHSCMSLDV